MLTIPTEDFFEVQKRALEECKEDTLCKVAVSDLSIGIGKLGGLFGEIGTAIKTQKGQRPLTFSETDYEKAIGKVTTSCKAKFPIPPMAKEEGKKEIVGEREKCEGGVSILDNLIREKIEGFRE